ncbi:hypothetical protein [Loigolactobacillus bifermentans]|nr:hypothetical protein [Loigolactobacillus bifermentans]QGG60186.1 hypothetical protein LB003_06805 [Loigolactobacillus bifermentans]
MKIKRTKTFKKQYKACQKRGYSMATLDAAIIAIVENDATTLKAQSDHDLKVIASYMSEGPGTGYSGIKSKIIV